MHTFICKTFNWKANTICIINFTPLSFLTVLHSPKNPLVLPFRRWALSLCDARWCVRRWRRCPLPSDLSDLCASCSSGGHAHWHWHWRAASVQVHSHPTHSSHADTCIFSLKLFSSGSAHFTIPSQIRLRPIHPSPHTPCGAKLSGDCYKECFFFIFHKCFVFTFPPSFI